MCEPLAERIFAVVSHMVCARFAPNAGCCEGFALLLALVRRRCVRIEARGGGNRSFAVGACPEGGADVRGSSGGSLTGEIKSGSAWLHGRFTHAQAAFEDGSVAGDGSF